MSMKDIYAETISSRATRKCVEGSETKL